MRCAVKIFASRLCGLLNLEPNIRGGKRIRSLWDTVLVDSDSQIRHEFGENLLGLNGQVDFFGRR